MLRAETNAGAQLDWSGSSMLGLLSNVWLESVRSVTPKAVLQDSLAVIGGELIVCNHRYELGSDVTGVIVVGFGKAAGAMARECENILAQITQHGVELEGYVNTPEFEELEPPLEYIFVNQARPQGSNRPTELAALGTKKILDFVQHARPTDIVLVLISGGGSALSPAPLEGMTLAQKENLTVLMNEKLGLPIEEINVVRRALSRIKGGGLARASGAKAIHGLIISDVIGDALEVISSGPLVESSTGPEAAMSILKGIESRGEEIPAQIFSILEDQCNTAAGFITSSVYNHVLAGNNIIVKNALQLFHESGVLTYESLTGGATTSRVAKNIVDWILKPESGEGAHALVVGGEPLVDNCSRRGKGGRNQHLALTVLALLLQKSTAISDIDFCILAGGTDGEDGPTDAAGAMFTNELLGSSSTWGREIYSAIENGESYRFFEQYGGLFLTGLTGTNVCDLALVLKRKKN